jgi:hypothetical protein
MLARGGFSGENAMVVDLRNLMLKKKEDKKPGSVSG